jgi:hypothetical protein
VSLVGAVSGRNGTRPAKADADTARNRHVATPPEKAVVSNSAAIPDQTVLGFM